MANPRGIWINSNNLIPVSIYYSVRKCIGQTWLNDRDQFLIPKSDWLADLEFQSDCLIYTLFNTNIKSEIGTNFWIPFTEQEVDAREKFESDFMSRFIQGGIKQDGNPNLFGFQNNRTNPIEFSSEAQEVFNAGREIWKYYHKQPNCNVNASLYDIREYFQGRNHIGKMNNKCSDEIYTDLIFELRNKLSQLAAKIAPKIYVYGFLKQ